MLWNQNAASVGGCCGAVELPLHNPFSGHEQKTMINRQNNFDLIRLIAAFQVVYIHTIIHLELWGGPKLFVDMIRSLNGVMIFFIVSGFLVTDSYLSSVHAGQFAIKRALRIYPALIINILALEASVYFTAGKGPITSGFEYAGFLSIFSLTAAQPWAAYFFPWPYDGFGAFIRYPSGVLWTLSVELTFYLVLPLFLEMWRRSPKAGLLYIVAAATGSFAMSHIYSGYKQWHDFINLSTLPYFWIFSIGVFVRLLWPTIRNAFEGKFWIWLALHCGAFALVPYLGTNYGIAFYSNGIFDVARLLIVAGLAFSFAFTRPRPHMLRGCDISYGVYLYHMLIIYWVTHWGFNGKPAAWLAVFIPTVGAGLLSWKLVESPILEIRKRLKQSSEPSRT